MSTRKGISLTFPHWPATDQAAWQWAVQPGGLFDEQGPAAHWAASTRRTIQYDYGIWLRWCEREGCLSTPSIDERVTPQRIRDYIDHLQPRVSPVTLHTYMAALQRVMNHFCPASDWQWLQTIVNRLERLAVPITDKAARLQDSADLLELGHTLMTGAPLPMEGQTRRDRVHAAIQYRDGLMIALLATRPLRRTNFVGIRLDQHLYQVDRIWWLCYQAGETKQARPIEQPVPTFLHDQLDTYLAAHRPCFPGADRHDYLWASAKGGPLTFQGFYQSIIKRTRQAFGESVNPHLFRDCAATTIARHTPEQVGIASQILGHSNLATTERHYNQAGSVSASRHFQASLAAIRAGNRAAVDKGR